MDEFDKILIDPATEIARASWAPQRIVYVFCNSAMLVRDSKILWTARLAMLDMLPHSGAILSRWRYSGISAR